MRVGLFSSLLAVIVLASPLAHAKIFDIAAVRQTQSGRKIIKATNGNFYVELKPGETRPEAATAQDVYEAYRGQMRRLMVNDRSQPSDDSGQPNSYVGDRLLNDDFGRRGRRGILGISFGTMKLIHGAITEAPGLADRSTSELSGSVYTPESIYETGRNTDVLLVRTCPRLRQHSDALDDQAFDCHPSLTFFVKFRRKN
jgi:hypothetical protein